MQHNRIFVFLFSIGSLTLFLAASACAAPLTWFPGPALYAPQSGAATVVNAGNNVLVGGDAYADPDYPETVLFSLAATNSYWSSLGVYYSLNIAGGAIVSDGNIVIYGGTDGTSSQNTVFPFNLTGDSVSALLSMNVARSYFGFAPDKNGNAYAFGGLDANGNPLASAERFNPVNNNVWTYTAPLPTARYNFPVVFNRTNYIYIFGGLTDTTSGIETASVLRYSVSGNSWSNMVAMPVAVAGSAATLGPDGKIYVIGGTCGGVSTNVVQVYNPTANSWVVSTPLPEGLSLASAGVDALGRLVVMGGVDANGNDVSDVWRSQLLTAPDSAPQFTSYPTLAATYLVPYSSSITATGNPQPTYQVVTGPAGMSVDPDYGTIAWTPQASQIGTNQVTITAVNYAGSTNWTYNFIIANPPPTVLTNLQVVSVTESSVTLSWSPEDPLVGPVTYTVWLRHVLHDPKGSGATVWYTQLGSTAATNVTIGGLAAGLSQAYYITATGVSGTSGYASIGATTLTAPTPTNLQVTGLTSTTISLTWNPPVGPVPVASYSIIGVFNGVFVQYPLGYANILTTNFTITGLAPGTALLLGVCGKDIYGNVSGYDYLPSLVINPASAPVTLATVSPRPPPAAAFKSLPPKAAPPSRQF